MKLSGIKPDPPQQPNSLPLWVGLYARHPLPLRPPSRQPISPTRDQMELTSLKLSGIKPDPPQQPNSLPLWVGLYARHPLPLGLPTRQLVTRRSSPQ